MSFPRYPAYKDSGVNWLGEVPGHWRVLPVKRVLHSIEQGWSPQCESYPAESGQWGVLKVGCVNGGKFNPEENKALPNSLEPDPSLAIRRDDVMVSRANTRELVGSVAVATQDYQNLLLCDKLYRLRVDASHCKPAFLARYLGGSASRTVIESAATGASSSMLNIGQSAIVDMPVALPPISEQRALLQFLDHETAKIEALVEEQKRLIELLKEKRQAVISQAVTKGLDPNVPMKDSGVKWLGVVPAHWTVTPLKHVVQLRSGGTPDKSRRDYWDGDIPWASAKDLKAAALFDTADHITEVALTEGAATLVDAGVVLVVVRGMILARTFPVVTARFRVAINQDLKAVAARAPSRNDWLAWLLRASSSETLSRLDEAGHGTKALRMDAWGNMPIAVPPPAEQRHIASFLESRCTGTDELVAEAERAIALLKERRSALISAAVTGKIDVRSAASHIDA